MLASFLLTRSAICPQRHCSQALRPDHLNDLQLEARVKDSSLRFVKINIQVISINLFLRIH